MRTSILAIIAVAGSAIAFQATAQQAAPSDLTKEQIQQRDADKGLKTSGEPNEQMQRDADKGLKTSEPNKGKVLQGNLLATPVRHTIRAHRRPTGLNRKDGETGTDTSTHNPTR